MTGYTTKENFRQPFRDMIIIFLIETAIEWVLYGTIYPLVIKHVTGTSRINGGFDGKIIEQKAG
jgi:hypothetical protein